MIDYDPNSTSPDSREGEFLIPTSRAGEESAALLRARDECDALCAEGLHTEAAELMDCINELDERLQARRAA